MPDGDVCLNSVPGGGGRERARGTMPPRPDRQRLSTLLGLLRQLRRRNVDHENDSLNGGPEVSSMCGCRLGAELETDFDMQHSSHKVIM